MSFTYAKQVLSAGGLVLWLLGALSVYTIALIWERAAAFHRFRRDLEDASERVRQALKSGSVDKVSEAFKGQKDPVHWILARVLATRGSRDERRDASERIIDRQINRLESGLTTLATIGSTAPFIGLFGTVLGVMRAFRDLAAYQGAGPSIIAVGISEALVTTAAGLFVAIPAVIAYNMLHRRTESFTQELAWLTEELLDRGPLG